MNAFSKSLGLLIALFTFAACEAPSASAPSSARDEAIAQLLVNVPGIQFPTRTAVQLKAYGLTASKQKVDLSAKASWKSLDATVARIGPSGIAQLDGAGLARFEVRYGDFVVPVEIAVTAAQLVSVTLTPEESGTLAMGDTRRFTARARFDDGSSLDVTDRASWRTDEQAFALTGTPGQIVGRAEGVGQLRVTYFTQEASALVTIGKARFTGVALPAPTVAIKPGDLHRLSFFAVMSDGTRREVTNESTWTSSNPDVVSLTMDGVDRGIAFARSAGNVEITARWQDSVAQVSLTVVPRAVTHVDFDTHQLQLAQGRTAALDVFATLDDGSRVVVTDAAAWFSSQPAVAEVSRGVVGTYAQGVATITAWYAGYEATYQLEVTPPELERIGATLTGGRLAIGQTAEFIIGGTFSDGSTLNLSAVTTLDHDASITSGVANGRVRITGANLGPSIIDVSIGAMQQELTFEVTDVPLTAITFVDSADRSPWLPTGKTGHQLRAIGTYGDGAQLDVTELCNWWVDDANVVLLSDEPGRRGSFELATGGSTTLNVYIAGNVTSTAWVFAPNP